MTPRPLIGIRTLLVVSSLVTASFSVLIALATAFETDHPTCSRGPSSSSMISPLVGDVLRMHDEDVRFCEQESAELGDAFKGRIEMRISVRADGSVEDVKAATVTPVSSTSEIPAHVLTGCLEAAVFSWRFPYTGSPNVLVVPLNVR